MEKLRFIGILSYPKIQILHTKFFDLGKCQWNNYNNDLKLDFVLLKVKKILIEILCLLFVNPLFITLGRVKPC